MQEDKKISGQGIDKGKCTILGFNNGKKDESDIGECKDVSPFKKMQTFFENQSLKDSSMDIINSQRDMDIKKPQASIINKRKSMKNPRKTKKDKERSASIKKEESSEKLGSQQSRKQLDYGDNNIEETKNALLFVGEELENGIEKNITENKMG